MIIYGRADKTCENPLESPLRIRTIPMVTKKRHAE